VENDKALDYYQEKEREGKEMGGKGRKNRGSQGASTCYSGEDVPQKHHNISEAHYEPPRYVELREETREAHSYHCFV
jgi:hypothetical protein